MAKKLGKIVLLTALASAAAAGGIALYNKYKASSDDFDDDFLDFDDEDEDDDFDAVLDDTAREYVSIPRESSDKGNDDGVVKSDNYNVNVDVSIDTSNFKDEDETEDDIFFETEDTADEAVSDDTDSSKSTL